MEANICLSHFFPNICLSLLLCYSFWSLSASFFSQYLYPCLSLTALFLHFLWRWAGLNFLHSYSLCFHSPQFYNVMTIIRKYNSLCLTLLFIIYSRIFFTFLISSCRGELQLGGWLQASATRQIFLFHCEVAWFLQNDLICYYAL